MAVEAFRNANAMLSFGGFLLFVGIVFLPFNLYSAAQMLDRMYVDPGSAEWNWIMPVRQPSAQQQQLWAQL